MAGRIGIGMREVWHRGSMGSGVTSYAAGNGASQAVLQRVQARVRSCKRRSAPAPGLRAVCGISRARAFYCRGSGNGVCIGSMLPSPRAIFLNSARLTDT